MTPKQYQEAVLKTESNDFQQIRERMYTEKTIRLDHAADGLVTEAGEFKDALKKYKFYGKPYEKSNLIEELGDSLWYIGIACDALGISIEEVMEINIEKLKSRYGDTFNKEGAINRDLVEEKRILLGVGPEFGEECLRDYCKYAWLKHFVHNHEKLKELYG